MMKNDFSALKSIVVSVSIIHKCGEKTRRSDGCKPAKWKKKNTFEKQKDAKQG